jgi:hypothetical protein
VGNYIWWARGPVRIALRDEAAALWRFKAAARGWDRNDCGDVESVEGASSLDEALSAIEWNVCRDAEGNIFSLELSHEVRSHWWLRLEESIEALDGAALGSYVLWNPDWDRPKEYWGAFAFDTGSSQCEGCERPHARSQHIALAAAHSALSLAERALRERPNAVPCEVRRLVIFGLAAIRAHVFKRRESPPRETHGEAGNGSGANG